MPLAFVGLPAVPVLNTRQRQLNTAKPIAARVSTDNTGNPALTATMGK